MREIHHYQRFSSRAGPLRPTQTTVDRASRGANCLPYWPPFRRLDLSTTDAPAREAPLLDNDSRLGQRVSDGLWIEHPQRMSSSGSSYV